MHGKGRGQKKLQAHVSARGSLTPEAAAAAAARLVTLAAFLPSPVSSAALASAMLAKPVGVPGSTKTRVSPVKPEGKQIGKKRSSNSQGSWC